MRDSYFNSHPRIGIAYSGYIPAFLTDHRDAVDFIEIPFELLRSNPATLNAQKIKPLVLHCASLSIAGSVAASEQTVEEVKHWINKTRTPWLGEHLAFVTAEREPTEGTGACEWESLEPYDVGYSVNPPTNEDTLQTVLHSIATCEKQFKVPILLENSPLYFVPPGTTMTQVEFLQRVCAGSSTRLLLDLSHFYITAQTMGFDPCDEVLKLPLHRVVEVHISGVDFQHGVHWDDHTKRAPDIVFELLSLVLARTRLKAVTLEYNWSTHFPRKVVLEEIARTREVISSARPKPT